MWQYTKKHFTAFLPWYMRKMSSFTITFWNKLKSKFFEVKVSSFLKLNLRKQHPFNVPRTTQHIISGKQRTDIWINYHYSLVCRADVCRPRALNCRNATDGADPNIYKCKHITWGPGNTQPHKKIQNNQFKLWGSKLSNKMERCSQYTDKQTGYQKGN